MSNSGNIQVSDRRPYIFLDLGFYAACNLACTYCRPEKVRDDRSFTLDDLKREVALFCRRYTAAVVKLSGYGEITMWTDFKPSLNYLSKQFPSVQVITNGTFGPHIREAILDHDNVSPNITLDGHTLRMNQLRVKQNETHHHRILENIKAFVQAGRAVEINCVLHKYNVDELEEFMAYLSRIDAGRGLVMLIPFPVKPFDRAMEVGMPLRQGIETLADRIPDLWQRYQQILPAHFYGASLSHMLKMGFRRGGCHVHWANLGSGSRDQRLHCANYGEALSYGSMLTTLHGKGAEKSEERERINLGRGHVGPNCQTCFNHFHVINDFLEERLSLEEFCRLPSLRPAGTMSIVQHVQDHFRQECIRLATSMGNIE